MMPVRDWMRVDLPWSTWPAVPTTYMFGFSSWDGERIAGLVRQGKLGVGIRGGEGKHKGLTLRGGLARVGGRFLPSQEQEWGLDVEEEGDDVAVVDVVAAALGAEEALSSGVGDRGAGDHVVKGEDFGADEAAFHVGVDCAGGGGGVGAFGDGPGPDFVGDVGEEGDPVEEGNGAGEEEVPARFSGPHGLAKLLLIFGGELGDFPFETGAEGEGVVFGIQLRKGMFADVEYVHDGLVSQEVVVGEDGGLFGCEGLG